MQVLYRKYRPKTFDEIIGQDHVVRTLKGALLNNRVGHAYLFSGPRGVGKTTIARILAKSLNCANFPKISEGNFDGKSSIRQSLDEGGHAIPCNKCSSCQETNDGRSLDIIEIDAASNRGIEEIRNLRDSARVAASSGRFKIFIVDEVHMLTAPAFSALLKTLEEPPSHVVFILATTDPHKVAPTILSRVQRFEFKKISPENINARLRNLAKLEKISIEEPASRAIALSAEGSLRDAESSLSKLIAFAGESITMEHVEQILGIIPSEVHQSFFEALVTNNREAALKIIESLYNDGVSLDVFAKQFIEYVRFALLLKVAPDVAGDIAKLSESEAKDVLKILEKTQNEKIIAIMDELIAVKNDIKNSPIPQLPLELAIIRLTK